MVFCVILSGMRGIWVAIPFVTAVILWACVRTLSGVTIRRAVLAAAASVVIGVGLTGGTIWDRLEQFSADIAQIAEQGDYDSSTGRRLLMYDAAWSAILEAPWSGYGIDERMDAVQAHVPADRRDLVPYNHPHNGFLAALLDAGVTGLVALCLLMSAPVVIGRDHLDSGSVASPNRETEGMKDGSDAVSDWPLLNALLNTASGATWVSLHHGGGVGMGYSQHSGMVIVADGTPEAAKRLERVLWNDPATGVMRHADAGYEIAKAAARAQRLNLPSLEG